jgi:hypothetical protein
VWSLAASARAARDARIAAIRYMREAEAERQWHAAVLAYAHRARAAASGDPDRARALQLVEAPAPVACGIPGFDQRGQEVIAGTFRVDDAPLGWGLHGRCGFADGFAYSSDD